MPENRRVAMSFSARPAREGAGVLLNRAFGYSQLPMFDPFLMLDDFRSGDPAQYLAGFPWHPHRGIETVTYMLEGMVEHGDSLGHSGTIAAGDVQWMTAGSGIIHQEMPKPVNGRMGGFQLWINLPRSHKMIDPRYQEIPAGKIPSATLGNGSVARAICGTVAGITGPVRDIMASPEYFDITLAPHAAFSHPVRPGYMAAAYIIGGSGLLYPTDTDELENRTMVLFSGDGSKVTVTAGKTGMRFLYFSGRPIQEQIAWGGPMVLNTQAELKKAFDEYQNGTFIRHKTA